MASTMSFGHLPMGPTLAELGFETLDLFQQVQDTEQLPDAGDEYALNSFAGEAERFELWAVNLGLFVGGHGSLDYRVREAERLGQTIRRFMKELNDSLAEAVEIRIGTLDGDGNTEDDEDVGPDGEDAKAIGTREMRSDELADIEEDDVGDDEDDDNTDESDMDILVEDVRDSIDRLYKVSTKIRSPSSRLGSSRAAKHQQIDDDTGVDFLQAIEQSDYDHIRELFLQYQVSRVLQEQEPSEPKDSTFGAESDDGVWEPIRSVLAESRNDDCYLIKRLARANVRRRQQFAYWKKHRDKLLNHARASLSSQSAMTPRDEAPSRPSAGRHLSSDMTPPIMSELAPPPMFAPSVTTATNLNPAKFETMEVRSTISVSEYAVSTWQPARDAVAFPPPPREHSGDKFFECPYCFTFCPRGTLADKAWKAHMIHDLRPYICTYEDCRNPDQLYDNRQDWEQHENSCHRKVWRCPEHSDLMYTQLDAYRDHLQSQHGESEEASFSRIVRASESTLSVTDRPCPICSIVMETPRAMQSHIALHLERFALFSLPRSVVCADEEISDADSDAANGTLEASRDEDFAGDSENIGSDVGEEDAMNTRQPGTATQSEGDVPADAVKNMMNVPEIKFELTEEAITKLNSQAPIPEEERRVEPQVKLTVTATTVKVFEDHDTPVYMMVFSPDDKRLVSVSDDRVVRFWDLETGASLPSFSGHKKGFRSVAWSPDGKTIASGSYDKTIKLWDVATGECLHTLAGHSGAVSGLAFTSDSKLLASASHDKICKLWDVETGTEKHTLRGHTVGNFSIGISPDDKYIVSGSNDKTAKIWDIGTGALVRTIKGHARVVYAVGFGRDGILATGSNDWSVKLWDLETGAHVRTLKGHEQGVTSIAFSPDKSLMATGAYDDKVRIWDTSTWETVCVLEGHTAHVYGVAFSRDGKRLASGSRDRTVRLWDLTVEKGEQAGSSGIKEGDAAAAQWTASVPVISLTE